MKPEFWREPSWKKDTWKPDTDGGKHGEVSLDEMLTKHVWNRVYLGALILVELSGVTPHILVYIGLRTHHTHTHTHTHSGLIFSRRA
jgi:hypothetical protein